MSDITMYWGAASGSARKALRQLEEPNIMISFATQLNEPWDGIDRLFIDCGGYSMMVNGDGHPPREEYVEYLRPVKPERYALPDYPCEPELLSDLHRTVKGQQERTTNHHVKLLNELRDRGIADNAVSVIQGWRPHDYLSHIDQLRDRGLMTDRMAIGSVCRRGADQDIAQVILRIREQLPDRISLHAFGVKGSVLRFPKVVRALDSVDSAAYDYQIANYPKSRTDGDSFTWRDSARAYLNWRHRLQQTIANRDENTHQSELTEVFAHE